MAISSMNPYRCTRGRPRNEWRIYQETDTNIVQNGSWRNLKGILCREGGIVMRKYM